MLCFVWDGLGETLSTKIQKLQNRAVRVITRSSYDTNASVLLNGFFKKAINDYYPYLYRR